MIRHSDQDEHPAAITTAAVIGSMWDVSADRLRRTIAGARIGIRRSERLAVPITPTCRRFEFRGTLHAIAGERTPP